MTYAIEALFKGAYATESLFWGDGYAGYFFSNTSEHAEEKLIKLDFSRFFKNADLALFDLGVELES